MLSKIYIMSLASLRKMIVILFVSVIMLAINGKIMATESTGRIKEGLLKATVRIETPTGTSGTGFIISKPSKSDGRYYFLVTNKHLIGDYLLFDGKLDTYYDFIKVYCYKKDGSIQEIDILLKDEEGQINRRKVYPYPEPHIDIALISIADDLEKVRELDKWSFDLSYLATNEILKKWNVDIGDQVLALGYPYNIYSKSNYYPIAKSGYISSKIGEELIITISHTDKNYKKVERELKGKIILLDGTLVQGNSGGPIVVPRGRRERTEANTNEVQFTKESLENLVVGVQSQSFIKAGISIAFSSEYILELIDKIFEGDQEH